MDKEKIKEILKELEEAKREGTYGEDRLEKLKTEFCLEELKEIKAFLRTRCPNYKKIIDCEDK